MKKTLHRICTCLADDESSGGAGKPIHCFKHEQAARDQAGKNPHDRANLVVMKCKSGCGHYHIYSKQYMENTLLDDLVEELGLRRSILELSKPIQGRMFKFLLSIHQDVILRVMGAGTGAGLVLAQCKIDLDRTSRFQETSGEGEVLHFQGIVEAGGKVESYDIFDIRYSRILLEENKEARGWGSLAHNLGTLHRGDLLNITLRP